MSDKYLEKIQVLMESFIATFLHSLGTLLY